MQRSGLTALELEERFPKLSGWLAGDSHPTLRQLEEFARVTHTPLGILFLTEPPREGWPVPYHRTAGGTLPPAPSPNLRDTLYMMRYRQLWLSAEVRRTDGRPLPFVGTARPDERPESAAARMREVLGLDPDWTAQQATWTGTLHFLRTRMEAAGITVVINSIVGNNTRRRLDAAECRGFALTDPYAPWVFVNGADYKANQLLTLAHGLAHIVFGTSAAYDLAELLPAGDPIELACYRAAREFLLPVVRLRGAWSTVHADADPVAQMVRQFKVSPTVVARLALDEHLISGATYARYVRAYMEKEDRQARGGGGNFYLTQNLRIGVRFARRVAQAVAEGRLLFAEAYELTGLSGKTFDNYLRTIEGEVPPDV